MPDFDGLLDVGKQRSTQSPERLHREGACLNCVRLATHGSWCKWCHPVGLVEPWGWNEGDAERWREAADQFIREGRWG